MEPELHVFPYSSMCCSTTNTNDGEDDDGGGTDKVGEDTGDVCTAVVEVSASEVCVLLGVVVMLVVDDGVEHAGVSVDGTGREVKKDEEGEIVEIVDVGMSHVLLLQEEEAGDGRVAAVDPVDSEDEEAEDEAEDNRTAVIQQYFQ
ncbi:hypothetical protein NDU88_003184 [Pleurodeles waltl]|uniref:Uncharacterized protein n=1 Tax=Pleurodeles waltl TaxID=8319 RepID=A0AAV7W421_PLEWA|nr:hypothetical protein NDU88_003184 [Pleurodeles waltl]